MNLFIRVRSLQNRRPDGVFFFLRKQIGPLTINQVKFAKCSKDKAQMSLDKKLIPFNELQTSILVDYQVKKHHKRTLQPKVVTTGVDQNIIKKCLL